jgi:predicted nucleic acid-binding protein
MKGTALKRLVIDASILVKLFFEEEHSESCVRYVSHATELLAPDLLWVEAANVVWKRLRRNEITSADAAALVDEMLRVPIVTASHAGLTSPALALAAQTGRTVYDCLYLALAMRENIPMLTGDERLANSLAAGPYAKYVRFIGAPL